MKSVSYLSKKIVHGGKEIKSQFLCANKTNEGSHFRNNFDKSSNLYSSNLNFHSRWVTFT